MFPRTRSVAFAALLMSLSPAVLAAEPEQNQAQNQKPAAQEAAQVSNYLQVSEADLVKAINEEKPGFLHQIFGSEERRTYGSEAADAAALLENRETLEEATKAALIEWVKGSGSSLKNPFVSNRKDIRLGQLSVEINDLTDGQQNKPVHPVRVIGRILVKHNVREAIPFLVERALDREYTFDPTRTELYHALLGFHDVSALRVYWYQLENRLTDSTTNWDEIKYDVIPVALEGLKSTDEGTLYFANQLISKIKTSKRFDSSVQLALDGKLEPRDTKLYTKQVAGRDGFPRTTVYPFQSDIQVQVNTNRADIEKNYIELSGRISTLSSELESLNNKHSVLQTAFNDNVKAVEEQFKVVKADLSQQALALLEVGNSLVELSGKVESKAKQLDVLSEKVETQIAKLEATEARVGTVAAKVEANDARLGIAEGTISKIGSEWNEFKAKLEKQKQEELLKPKPVQLTK